MLSGLHILHSQALKLVETYRARDPERWGRAHPPAPPDADMTVRVVIPLIARARATDWARVSANLAATLASLERQTSDAWTVTVCGQDRPEGIAFDGDRLRFLPFPIPPLAVNSDKPRKLRFLVRDAAKGPARDGYIFPLDGDDLLHPSLLAHVVRDNNGHGYLMDRGYLISLSDGLVAPAMDPALTGRNTTPLHLQCGSTSILRFDLRRGRGAAIPVLARGKHREVPDRMARFGQHLRPVPFPAVLYNVGHGENLQTIRGYGARKIAYLRKHAIPDPGFEDVCTEFGLRGATSHGKGHR